MDYEKDNVVLIEPKELPPDKFTGPEFTIPSRVCTTANSSRRASMKMSQRNNDIPSVLTYLIVCTSCSNQINPFSSNAVFKHPVLKVILCKTCNDYYHSGEFDKDEEGIDNYCRWCGDGGKVCLCDSCTNVFCKSCIRRHVSRTHYRRIDTDYSWSCFVCDPTPIQDKVLECAKVLAALESYKNKAYVPVHSRKIKTKTKVKPGSFDSSSDEKGLSTSNNLEVNDSSMTTSGTRRSKSPPPSLQYKLRQSAKTDETSKVKDPMQFWKVWCLKELNEMQQRLSNHCRQFKDHFIDKNKDLSKKPSLSRNYTKVKAIKELKMQSDKLLTQCQTFSQLVEDERNQLKSLNEEEFNAFSDILSTTAKESDSDVTTVSISSRKKLRKRKDLDNARLSSSNEADSPKKSFQPRILFKEKLQEVSQSNDDLAQRFSEQDSNRQKDLAPPKLSSELSDSGSSRHHFNNENHPEPEVSISAASLSDIFDHPENVNDKKATIKANFTLPFDAVEVPDDSDATTEDSERLFVLTPSKAKLKTRQSTMGNNSPPKNISDNDSTTIEEETQREPEKIVIKTELLSSSADEKIKADAMKEAEVSVKLEAPLSDETFIESGSEYASDDQILPSPSNTLLEDTIGSFSNDADPSLVEAVNKIALSNLENEQLSQEEEDEDVKALLSQENEAKSSKRAKCQSEPEPQKESDEDDMEHLDDERKKKALYRNPLLKLRISLSDCEVAKKKRERSSRNKRKLDSVSSEHPEKKLKQELQCDEALNDPYLSDDDASLLNKKDEDFVLEDYKTSDEELLLSDSAETNSLKKNEKASTKELDSDTIPETQIENKNEENETTKVKQIVEDSKKSKSVSELIEVDSSSTGESSNEVDVEKSGSSSEFLDDDVKRSSQKRKRTKNQTSITDYLRSENQSSSEEFADVKPSEKRRRKRRRQVLSDPDEDCMEVNSNSEEENGWSSSQNEVKPGRKNIRKILDSGSLSQVTRDAEKEERERRKRIEKINVDEEIILIEDDSSPVKKVVPVKLILSKSPKIEVDQSIVCKLKEHQVEGIKFLWRNVVEDVTRANTSKGDGCILAHCMGLGKTLQTIAFLHAVLTSDHLPSLRSALVICPLGTALNWMSELRFWLKDCSQSVQIFEVDKSSTDNAKSLKRWQIKGGIAVIGYAKYRSICLRKSKTIPKAYAEIYVNALQNPGPDIVVCDEGHILKNEKTNLSAVVENIKSKRRIVLTGTPLQNNLVEYFCMVSFIKPRLLGDKKEFLNRFVNPILNGQHVDSTKRDVRLMKQRSHVLHELLAGCVQRKDVECLREHLQPKHEYVLLVRLSPLQVRLYEVYRKEFDCAEAQGSKGQIFQDFNNFLLINAHPRALQLAKMRQEYKDEQEGMKRFVVNESEDEEDETTTSENEDNDKNKIDISQLPNMSNTELKKIVKDHGGDLSNCIEKADLVERATKVLNPVKTKNDVEERSSWYDNVLPAQDNLIHNTEHSGKYNRKLIQHNESGTRVESCDENMLILAVETCSPQLNSNIMLLLEILRLAEEVNDKVVVFSQSLLTLDLIEQVLADVSRRKNKDKVIFGADQPTRWVRDFDYFRMDGSTQAVKRKLHVDRFNSKSNRRSRLFLISTRAGGIGINLVGANRAVLFDASWNPTHDVQSIFRIYRFGQVKPCYIYRLIGQGTMEEKIYDRQVVKQSLAFRVVDEQQIERHFTASDIAELYSFKPKKLEKKSKENSTPDHAPPKDKLLADLLFNTATRDTIVSYHEHDSLLDHQVQEELSVEERQLAWDEYDRERHPPVKPDDPMLKFTTHELNQLIEATEKELKQNGEFLEGCQDEPLHTIMLRLKLHKRDLTVEEMQAEALKLVVMKDAMKIRVERTRRFLIHKLEQLRYCQTRKVPPSFSPRPSISGPSTFQQRPPPVQRQAPPQSSYQSSFRPAATSSNWHKPMSNANTPGSNQTPQMSSQSTRASYTPNAANASHRPRGYAVPPRMNNPQTRYQSNPYAYGYARFGSFHRWNGQGRPPRYPRGYQR